MSSDSILQSNGNGLTAREPGARMSRGLGPTPLLEGGWRRLENAKLQLDHCHNYINDLHRDMALGGVPCADGHLACVHALRAQELAIENYRSVANDYRAMLLGEQVGGRADAARSERTGAHWVTPRERQVLALIASGKSSKQIAAQLGISFKTAVCHRYRLQTKLKAHNTADLTRAAVRMGLIEL